MSYAGTRALFRVVAARASRGGAGGAAVLPSVAVLKLSRTPVLVVGDGLAGLALATRLARRGWRPELLGASPDDGGDATDDGIPWLGTSAALARDLPASSVLETSMPVDVVLAGGFPVATRARAAIIDVAALRRRWRRRAAIAGVRLRSGARARRVERAGGRVVGVDAGDAGTLRAPLTVDASGEGMALASVFGAAVGRSRLPEEDTELVALARARTDPRRIDPAWVGRLQLLLGLERPGALGWRGATRDGRTAVAAVTAGPGGTAEDLRQLVSAVLRSTPDDGPPRVHLTRLPRRRVLDVIGADGVVAFGAAAAIHDTLLGFDVETILRAADALALALDPCRALEAPATPDLFAASRAVQRAVGATLAQRLLLRRALDGWTAAEREALVLSGALGPRSWFRAVEGVAAPWTAAALVAGRLQPTTRRAWSRLLRRAAALRAHHARYPRRYDLFAIDRWQARTEDLVSCC